MDQLNERTDSVDRERSMGPFVLEAEIGRGGMGVVYRARRGDDGEVVALKLMAPELSHNPKFRERFLQEAEVAPRLDHPNVVPVYESGEVDGELFIVMRLIEGVDLAELVAREGPLDIPRALEIFRQAAAALDASHEAGIVHRDVKPQNILVVPRKTPRHKDFVYLTDFGLIRPVSSDTTASRTGQIFGSVPYMAPELIENKPADGRADVYSLGCVLYECLTGASPFSRDNEISLIWAHIHDDPPKVTGKRPELNRGVDDVVIRSLSKHPDDRYLTCGEMVTDLELRAKRNVSDLAYRRMRPLVDRPKRRKTESDVWAPNYFPELSRIRATTRQINWTKVAGFVAVLVMLSSIQVGREGGIPQAISDATDAASSVGGSVVDAVLGEDEPPAGKSGSDRTSAVGSQDVPPSAPVKDTAASDRRGLKRRSSSGGLQGSNEQAPEVTQANVPSAEIVFTAGTGQGREIYVTTPDGGGVTQLTDNDASDDLPVWSPSGKWIAFYRLLYADPNVDEIWVMKIDGSQQRLVIALPAVQSQNGWDQVDIGWSPDGKRLVYSVNNDIYTVNVDGTRNRLLAANGAYPDWSPDGRRIVFSRSRGIWVMRSNGSGQQQLTVYSQGRGADGEPTWSPGGSEIAFTRAGLDVQHGTVYGNDQIFAMNADGTNLHPVTAGLGERQQSWSPSGTALVYMHESDIYLIDADGSNERRLTNDNGNDHAHPDWRWPPT